MGIAYSIKIPTFFSYKVKFTRETPNDFYISGDRVEGIIELSTNETNDLDAKYGSLHVDLIGELQDLKKNKYQRYTEGVKIFFRKRTRLIPIPNTIEKKTSLRVYRWSFHGLLDSFLPSSLPPKDEWDPCICYYAFAYFDRNHYLTQKSSFLVFTRSPLPISISNAVVQSTVTYKSVELHCSLLHENGLIAPGKQLRLEIEIVNPFEQIMKSIRVKLQQYRFIIHEETDLNIFSFLLPDFESKAFHEKYRKCTYELPIPLDKCRLMAPTSYLKRVRYELEIQCCLSKKDLLVKLPMICTTDHQSTLTLPEEFRSISQIAQHRSQNQDDKQPPTYEDFLASELLPKYDEIFH